MLGTPDPTSNTTVNKPIVLKSYIDYHSIF